MNRYVAWAAAAIVMLGLVASRSAAQEPAGAGLRPGETSILASGTGRVSRAPDYVDIILGVSADAKSAGDAQGAASAAMERIIAAVKALSLENAELKSGDIRLSPRYERQDYGETSPRIIGYSAQMSLRVRTKDVKSPARVIDAALGAGANRVDGVEFGIREAVEAREEAIRLASKAAKRKLQVLAHALDLRVVRLVNVVSSTDQQGPWAYGNRFSNLAVNDAKTGGAGMSEGSVEPGMVEVTAEVTLTAAGTAIEPGGK